MDHVTPVIITYNEEANITRCLAGLKWAEQIIVVDSFSTDNTLSLLKGDSRIQVVQRKFGSFADQFNFAATQVKTSWILALDADYYLPEEFSDELKRINVDALDGLYLQFSYAIFGKKLRGSLYPPKVRCYRIAAAKIIDDGHAEKIVLNGKTATMKTKVIHDDRKPLSRFIQSQMNYCKLEVNCSSSQKWSQKNLPDKVRHFYLISPFIVFFYCLVVKGCFLDGKAGVFYAFQRFVAELIGTLYILKQKLKVKTE